MSFREEICIIAEAGVNHNGSLDLALRMVDSAAEAGADVVKFQTFKAEQVISVSAPKAKYQLANTGNEESQLEMGKRLELSPEDHEILIERCRTSKIEFLSTPFDIESADLLSERLGLRRLKISSGEITNAPLLIHVARKGLPVILSTGMSTLGEIEDALGALAFGFLGYSGLPSQRLFREAYVSCEGRKLLNEMVSILHCTTEYPAPFDEVNLRVLDTLKNAFELPVGYSDHTKGIAVSIAAAARGACIIEKHFTLDCGMPGPDHKASLEPEEFAGMVRGIRQVEKALGSSQKIPGPRERNNLDIARKSLVTKRFLKKGDVISEDDIACKRPGYGISPMNLWDVIGRTAPRDFEADEVLEI